MTDILLQSAVNAARMIAGKAISSRELLELVLARIDAVNPVVNAVVELRRDAAWHAAAWRTTRQPVVAPSARCTASP